MNTVVTTNNVRSFRDDINGLRAIAVSLVVAFHFGLFGIAGGFSGVDVFFVISGFLMTQILLRRLETGQIAVIQFYMARARRIVPALLCLCIVLLMFSLICLDPLTFRDLAAEALSALLFVSNFWLASKGGYFGAPPAAHWLLHTWSLSTEWQFYLIYPFMFVVVAKRYLAAVMVGVLVVSLILCVALSLRGGLAQSIDFYLLPSRAWELLAGGLVALAPVSWPAEGRARRLCHYVGLAAILVGGFVLNGDSAWPSAMTILPVAGTALVLLSDFDALWCRLRVVKGLGLCSYSIYLWHWPVIAAAAYFGLPWTFWPKLALAAASIGVGCLSYLMIEVRFTRALFDDGRMRPLFMAMLAPTLVLTAAACTTTGFEAARTSPAAKAQLAADERASGDWSYPQSCQLMRRQGPLDLCFVGNPTSHDVLVIGDSHAQQLVPRYAALLNARSDQGALFITHTGCIPLLGVGTVHAVENCNVFVPSAYQFALTSHFKRIVIVSTWLGYFEDYAAEGQPRDLCFIQAAACDPPKDNTALEKMTDQAFDTFKATLVKLRATGAEVYVSNPAPYAAGADPLRQYRDRFFHRALTEAISRRAFEQVSNFVRSRVMKATTSAGAVLVDPLDTLCVHDDCPVSANGQPLYMDRSHFRASIMTQPRFGYLDSAILGSKPAS